MADQGNVVPLPRQSQRPPIAIDAERPSETWLTAQIVAMLSIYYQPDEDPDVAKLGLALWADCLSDLPREAIERAIRRRLQSSSRSRPVPGEIRELALAELEKRARVAEPPPFGPMQRPLDEDERMRVVNALNDLSRRLGGASIQRMRMGSIERIFAVAAEVCGIPVKALRSQRKSADVVMPRFLACLACRDHTAASFPEIGRMLGDRDHTTILHAVAEAEKRINSDPAWGEAYAEINRRLAG